MASSKREASGSTLGAITEAMIAVIDDTRRLATKAPVDTSSFISMAFYLGELRDALTHLNVQKNQRIDLAVKNPEAYQGLQRLKGALERLKKLTAKASNHSSRLLLILDTAKVMGDLQSAVQDVGHDLNLVPILSLMASSLPSDVQDKVADLRTRMRSSRFDSEAEVLELAVALEEAVVERSKEKATDALVRVLRHFGASTNLGASTGSGNKELERLVEEVEKDLKGAEKDQRWGDVGKLLDIKTFLGLASLSQEPPIVQAKSRLALRLQEADAELAMPPEFKCSLTGEVMRDPVMLKETKETYDRNAIEAWFGSGKRSCPKSKKNLRSFELAPNSALRKKIERNYDRLNVRTLAEAVRILQRNHDEAHGRSGAANAAADAGEGEEASRQVQNGPVAGEGGGGVEGAEERVEDERERLEEREKLEEALEALQQLTALDIKFATKALELGAVVPLVELVKSPTPAAAAGALPPRPPPPPPPTPATGDGQRERCLTILKNIASTGDEAVMVLLEAGVVGPLVKLVSADAPDVGAAVALLKALSLAQVARGPVTEELGIVEAIKLLNKHEREGEADEVGKEVASMLEMYWRDEPYVAIQMASCGMFNPLIQLLHPDNDVETRMMMADGVMQWGVNKASRITLVQGGVLPPLVDLLSTGPVEAKKTAARSIEHLSHTDINRVALAKAGVIPALVKALAHSNLELKQAAQATLANLAMDDQDLDSLDEDGTALRLITLLRRGQQNRDYAVRTLECMSRESKTIRSALMEDDGAIPAIFEVLREGPSHVFTSGSLRSTALLLLSHLCSESGAKELMVAQPDVIKILFGLLSRPIPNDERQAIAVLFSTMVGNKQMRLMVRHEEQVYTLLHKMLQSGTPKVQEKMMWGFAHLSEHDDADPQAVVEAQQALAKLGLIPMAVHYTKMGPDVMRIPALHLLGNLSLSSPSLSMLAVNDRKQNLSVTKAWSKFTGSFSRSASVSGNAKERDTAPDKAERTSPGTKEKLRSCKVHAGKCSLEGTFCLVEGELVGVLLELVKRGEDTVAEVALSAVASLLSDKDEQERAAEYLVKQDVIEVAAGLVGRSKQLTKWAVYVLERIFEFKRFRSDKFAQPAISALGRYMTTATGQDRKTAAETIMRLNILPKGSMDHDL